MFDETAQPVAPVTPLMSAMMRQQAASGPRRALGAGQGVALPARNNARWAQQPVPRSPHAGPVASALEEALERTRRTRVLGG